MLGCEGLRKWKTSSFASLLWEVIDRPANSFTAVSLIKFIILVFKEIVFKLGTDLYNFLRCQGNDSEIYIIELGEGLGA